MIVNRLTSFPFTYPEAARNQDILNKEGLLQGEILFISTVCLGVIRLLLNDTGCDIPLTEESKRDQAILPDVLDKLKQNQIDPLVA